MSCFLPEDCIGFHKRWLEGGHAHETTDDLDTRDVIKALISLHHDMSPSHPTVDHFLSLMDRLNTKPHDPHRLQQILLSKTLIQNNQLTLMDAIFLVFSREELVA